MRHFIIAAVFAVTLVAQNSANAADPISNDSHAVTQELPAALAALDVRPSEFMTQSQAKEVRGEWLLNLNLALGHIYLQGHNKFELSVYTIGVGNTPNYGKPVKIWLQIGH